MCSLLVMVGLIVDDCKCSVELLGKDCADNLMREGHLGESNEAVGPIVDLLRETIGAANYESNPFGSCLLLLFYPCCKFGRTELLAAFVEQYDGVARKYRFQYQICFGLFLLCFAQFACVFQFGDYLDVEWGKMFYASRVVVDGRYEVFINGASYYYKCCLFKEF